MSYSSIQPEDYDGSA